MYVIMGVFCFLTQLYNVFVVVILYVFVLPSILVEGSTVDSLN